MASWVPHTESVRIISDGTARGTKVLAPNGMELRGVLSVAIHPIMPGDQLVADVRFGMVRLDVMAACRAPAQETFDAWMARRVEQAHQFYLQGQRRLSLLARDQ